MLKIKALQLNPIVGDIQGNTEKLLRYYHSALEDKTDILVTSECYLSGYPPEDLVLRPVFQESLRQAVDKIASVTKGQKTSVILGTPCAEDGRLYNAALFIWDGHISVCAYKQHLPDYGVFDEPRVFSIGKKSPPLQISHHRIGVMICEDMWFPHVAQDLKQQGATCLISLSASPFEQGKFEKRLAVAKARSLETDLPLLAVFQTGGQDEIIFDGRSFAVTDAGDISFLAEAYQEEAYDIILQDTIFSGNICSTLWSQDALVYQALVVSLRDYITKNHFKGIVLGLSGGLDSAISATIAVDAIGADKVTVLVLPSHYTSGESFRDADAVIKNLGIKHYLLSIEDAFETVQKTLHPLFAGLEPNIAEENLQSRLRGLYLMAYSNKFGAMVLTTGNKSEMAVGYATLYGDMCGGYNVLKDIYKTYLYDLCVYRNHILPPDVYGTSGIKIPETIMSKAPTAELRHNQKDSDSLPDYPLLDKILEQMIECENSVEDIIDMGYDEAIVKKIRHLVDGAEYKRRQSALGTKITAKAFGKDRRYPVVNYFRK